jgi:antitoxin MazE
VEANMLISIVPIGNSKGIRIPKNVLDQLNIEDKVELEVHENELLIKPIERKPREGWKAAFTLMNTNNDDILLLPDSIESNSFEWEW